MQVLLERFRTDAHDTTQTPASYCEPVDSHNFIFIVKLQYLFSELWKQMIYVQLNFF